MLQVYGTGIVTKDVEVKKVGADGASTLATASVAFKRSYKNRNGEWQDETTFVNCRAWGRVGERLARDLKKGDLVFISGRLTQENWTNKDGQKRSSLSVYVENFLLGVKTGKSNGKTAAPKSTADTDQPVPPVNEPDTANDPDVPF